MFRTTARHEARTKEIKIFEISIMCYVAAECTREQFSYLDFKSFKVQSKCIICILKRIFLHLYLHVCIVMHSFISKTTVCVKELKKRSCSFLDEDLGYYLRRYSSIVCFISYFCLKWFNKNKVTRRNCENNTENRKLYDNVLLS